MDMHRGHAVSRPRTPRGRRKWAAIGKRVFWYVSFFMNADGDMDVQHIWNTEKPRVDYTNQLKLCFFPKVLYPDSKKDLPSRRREIDLYPEFNHTQTNLKR